MTDILEIVIIATSPNGVETETTLDCSGPVDETDLDKLVLAFGKRDFPHIMNKIKTTLNELTRLWNDRERAERKERGYE